MLMMVVIRFTYSCTGEKSEAIIKEKMTGRLR